jgi:peroxiredoxin
MASNEHRSRPLSTLEAGALASHFTLLGLDGREYALPGDLGGQPAVIVFFRVKCPTCDLAFPYFNRMRAAYPDGWHLWAISQDDPARSAEYRDRFKLTYPVLIDAPGLDVSTLYDPPSTPTLFLIGNDGRVDYTSEGFMKDDLNELSRRLAGMLGKTTVEVAAAGDGHPAMKPGCMARQRMPVRR